MLENDLEIKEKEVYDLKHELIVSDSKAEATEKAAPAKKDKKAKDKKKKKAKKEED